MLPFPGEKWQDSVPFCPPRVAIDVPRQVKDLSRYITNTNQSIRGNNFRKCLKIREIRENFPPVKISRYTVVGEDCSHDVEGALTMDTQEYFQFLSV